MCVCVCVCVRTSPHHDTCRYVADRSKGKMAPAVLIRNQHDCGATGCTVIETDYYLKEALRRFDGEFPPECV